MAMPVPDIPEFEDEVHGTQGPETVDMAYAYRISARNHALAHLQEARHKEEIGGKANIYVTRSPLHTEADEAEAVLLTRSGKPLEFEETREQIELFFPRLTQDHEVLADVPLAIWIKHRNKWGVTRTFVLSEFGLEEEPVDGPRISRFRQVGKRRQTPEQAAKRYRDLIQHFKLTPQHHDPHAPVSGNI